MSKYYVIGGLAAAAVGYLYWTGTKAAKLGSIPNPVDPFMASFLQREQARKWLRREIGLPLQERIVREAVNDATGLDERNRLAFAAVMRRTSPGYEHKFYRADGVGQPD